MREFQDELVKIICENFPSLQRKRLIELREIIFKVTDNDTRKGSLSEQLRWGSQVI